MRPYFCTMVYSSVSLNFFHLTQNALQENGQRGKLKGRTQYIKKSYSFLDTKTLLTLRVWVRVNFCIPYTSNSWSNKKLRCDRHMKFDTQNSTHDHLYLHHHRPQSKGTNLIIFVHLPIQMANYFLKVHLYHISLII